MDVGIYPKSTIKDGAEIERTDWQNGWNSAYNKIFAKLETFYVNCQNPTEEWKMKVYLLAAEEIFLDGDGKIYANLNDTFYYACADAEEITDQELSSVYDAWKKDTEYGLIKWACKKRNMLPIPPIIEQMKKERAWESWLDDIKQEEEEEDDNKK